QQDVGLGQLHRVVAAAGATGLHPLVVVVDRDRERTLGLVLADDVLLEEVVDLLAEVDALVADVDPGASDELLDLLLALPAERALEKVTALTDSCHLLTSTSRGTRLLVSQVPACELVLVSRARPRSRRGSPPGSSGRGSDVRR